MEKLQNLPLKNQHLMCWVAIIYKTLAVGVQLNQKAAPDPDEKSRNGEKSRAFSVAQKIPEKSQKNSETTSAKKQYYFEENEVPTYVYRSTFLDNN